MPSEDDTPGFMDRNMVSRRDLWKASGLGLLAALSTSGASSQRAAAQSLGDEPIVKLGDDWEVDIGPNELVFRHKPTGQTWTLNDDGSVENFGGVFGSSGQFQYNDNGTLGGTTGYEWNDTEQHPQFPENNGESTLIDLDVTNNSPDGTEHSINIKLDGTKWLEFYNESDGAGGVDNFQMALGRDATVGTFQSLAVGVNASANAQKSTAVGQNATTSGASSTAIGFGAQSEASSVALGTSAGSNRGQRHTVIGQNASTGNSNSDATVVGQNASAVWSPSDAFGQGTNVQARSMALGQGTSVGSHAVARIGYDQLVFSAIKDTISDGDLNQHEVTFDKDEANNELIARVKYSDGTINTGQIPLS